MKKHIKITEQLMIEKMKGNPLFMDKISQLRLFPIFFHEDGTQAFSAAHQEAMVQGQANKGDEVTGMIPGKDKEDDSQE